MTSVRGDKSPMTADQESELRRLCRKTGESVEPELTRSQAACRINALQSLDTLPHR